MLQCWRALPTAVAAAKVMALFTMEFCAYIILPRPIEIRALLGAVRTEFCGKQRHEIGPRSRSPDSLYGLDSLRILYLLILLAQWIREIQDGAKPQTNITHWRNHCRIHQIHMNNLKWLSRTVFHYKNQNLADGFCHGHGSAVVWYSTVHGYDPKKFVLFSHCAISHDHDPRSGMKQTHPT